MALDLTQTNALLASLAQALLANGESFPQYKTKAALAARLPAGALKTQVEGLDAADEAKVFSCLVGAYLQAVRTSSATLEAQAREASHAQQAEMQAAQQDQE